jgi:uncharacterized protein YjbI with pentapeptide repeats
LEALVRDVDLSGADLKEADLTGANLEGANLASADLRSANLNRATLSNAWIKAALVEASLTDSCLSASKLNRAILAGANLARAKLIATEMDETDLSNANLSRAELDGASLKCSNLAGATLRQCQLFSADLSGANLSHADLIGANLISAKLDGTNLVGCRVYGLSVWNVSVDENTVQRDLIITPHNVPDILVDNIEVAQFLYLLLNNTKIRDVIDTITSKAVLILGRFTPERKSILEDIRYELRTRNYVPILFDFAKPFTQTTMEAISTLAHLVRFVIADITDAKSVLQELRGIVPNRPSMPVQPVLLAGQQEPGMFDFFKMYPWVLPVLTYANQQDLLGSLPKVLDTAETKSLELAKNRS